MATDIPHTQLVCKPGRLAAGIESIPALLAGARDPRAGSIDKMERDRPPLATKSADRGSPAARLDVIAGLSPDGKTLRIGVVNATFTAQPLNLDLKSLAVRGAGR